MLKYQNYTTTTRALQFLILTVARTSEVTLLKNDELDLEQKLWTIPDFRMKAKKAQDSCPKVIKLLGITNSTHNYQYIFPGSNPEKHLSNNAMGKFMRDHYRYLKCTVHGFRTTFDMGG